MRVVIAVGHAGIYAGGAHQALFAIAGLKRAGVDVAAIWGPDAEDDERGLDRLLNLNIPTLILPIHKRPGWEGLTRFREFIREFKPDVVEAIKSGAQYYSLLSLFGKNRPALVFYRGISRQMDYFQEVKYRLQLVDRIIVNSENLRKIMIRSGRLKPDKVSVVYGEFDPICGNSSDIDASGLRAELGIPEDKILITQLGNYAPWRGQDVTLKAAAYLIEKGCEYHYLFCGRETDKLLPLVKELNLSNFVTLSPFRRDPHRVIKITNIAVNASTANESLPGAVINFQAMGVPVVVSDIEGNREAVENGATGLFFQSGKPESLSNCILTLARLSKDEFSLFCQNSQKRAYRLFSSEERARRRLEVYRAAIENRMKNNK